MTRKNKEDVVASKSQNGAAAALPPKTLRGADKVKDPGAKSKSTRAGGKDKPGDILYYTRKLSELQG